MDENQETFSEQNRETISENRKGGRPFLWLILVALCIFLLVQRIGFSSLWTVFIAIAGFGLVIIIHEFGHFIVAKLMGMKVEAFSIGFPPTLFGIKRTEKGLRVRILPVFFRRREKTAESAEDGRADASVGQEDDNEEEGGLIFTVGKRKKPSDTEYRISLIPFGGYVRILGQEDIGRVKTIQDSRSYANKPVWMRMFVIAAGVTFNAILAAVLFIIIFNVGIKLAPPVVGGVMPGSPAQLAGLRAGDEIIEISGAGYSLDFGDIITAAALSAKDQQVPATVRHEDGSVEDFKLIARVYEVSGEKMKLFGIERPYTLEIGRFKSGEDQKGFYERTGLKPNDRVVAVNGKEVKTYWQLEEIISNTFEPYVALTTERIVKTKQEDGSFSEKPEFVKSREIRLSLSDGQKNPVEAGIYSLVPRMRIAGLSSLVAGPVRKGDIIVGVADVCDPNYSQFRRIVEEYENRELPLTVLRKDVNNIEKPVTITAYPRELNGRIVIGVFIEPDFNNLVIADIAADKKGKKLIDIPSGARITSVCGVKVLSFYDFAREMKKSIGKDVQITWQLDEVTKGEAVLKAEPWGDLLIVLPQIGSIPFLTMERLYKADGLADAIKMGIKRTTSTFRQSYLTIGRLLEGQVSPKSLGGPVAIATLSYQIVKEEPLIDYVFWIAMINVFIAVFNVLPLLPFDGGHIVFLLIEKIKGSPVSERIQNSFAAAGLILIGLLFIYVTFNDVIKTVKLFG